jgi:hypothetical protein
MDMGTNPTLTVRELDHRRSDGIDVKLLWNSRTDQVFVVVVDERSGEIFELGVDGADALEAFTHPHAYARRTRVQHALAA